jgi:endonuclease III
MRHIRIAPRAARLQCWWRMARNDRQVASALRKRYGDHSHYNRRNPLEELLYILCSTQTQESSYRSTYSALRREFSTFTKLAEAPAEYIAKPLMPGGLYRNKSKAIRQICDTIIQRFGRLTLSPLRSMGDRECEEFLLSLPGVGKKVARCVMMYSLDRQVFPVDTHCWRIARRLGWVRPTQKSGHCAPRDMDRLQQKLPPELRFSLHVGFVSLGREFCTAHEARCGGCPLEEICPKLTKHR